MKKKQFHHHFLIYSSSLQELRNNSKSRLPYERLLAQNGTISFLREIEPMYIVYYFTVQCMTVKLTWSVGNFNVLLQDREV